MAAKPLLLVTVALLLAVQTSFSIVKPALAATYTDVTVAEARVMIDTKPFLVLLDVRNQSEYDAGHIRNSKLIPVWELEARLNELNKTDEILVYCKFGGRSANASGILAANGFMHIYNMLGGISEWTRQENPVYIKYPSIQEAIYNATVGDTIYVSAGLYTEQLLLNKSVTLEGENLYTTIVNGSATMLTVTTDNVSVSDFTVRYVGCACYGYSSVNVTSSQNVSVTNNVIESDDFGIQVVNSSWVIIAANSITHTGNSCIVVLNSSEISVRENNIVAVDGIAVDTSTKSIVSDNTVFSTNGAGIFAYKAEKNKFFHNKVYVNDSAAISISDSYNNTFSSNSVSSEGTYGLFFWQSNQNLIFHNNFFFSGGQASNYNSVNLWDNGFEGNFWSHYTGTDNDSDGVGDVPNVLDSTNRDDYPLVGMFDSFNTSLGYDVGIVSNSTIDEFEYIEASRTIGLRVSNTTANQTIGFCRVSIPHSLIDPHSGSISVVVDNGQTPVLYLNNTLYDNGTHRWIYFTYPHSTRGISIVPEFPTFVILPLFMMAVAITATAFKRRRNSRAWEEVD